MLAWHQCSPPAIAGGTLRESSASHHTGHRNCRHAVIVIVAATSPSCCSPRRNRRRNTSHCSRPTRVTLPPAQIERGYPGKSTASLLIFWKAPQRLFAVAEHVRDQPNGVTSRLSNFRPYRPRLFVEAIKITVATVPDHSLAETQAQQPLIKLFTVGFSWLGWGAVRR
jgi:hypothetical protein